MAKQSSLAASVYRAGLGKRNGTEIIAEYDKALTLALEPMDALIEDLTESSATCAVKLSSTTNKLAVAVRLLGASHATHPFPASCAICCFLDGVK